jgi:hypothetical protein
MRRLLLALALTAFPAVAHAVDTVSNPHPGIKRIKRTTTSQNINVLVVNLCAPGVSVRGTKSAERGRTVSAFGQLVAAQAAINGDFFGTNYSTNGPSMGDGDKWGGNDINYVTPVQFGLNKVAMPPHEQTSGVEAWATQVVGGHPTILQNGSRRDNNGDPLCSNRNPRTALGFSADRRSLIVAVVDGRATGRLGYTCDELSALMKEFGAVDATNLDGGGSSTMWLAGTGVVNFPSDGQQRVVGNHLAIRAKGSGPAPHCPTPAFDADPVSTSMPVDVPMIMTSGRKVDVWFELDNTGLTAWSTSLTKVGTQDPQDRDSAFFDASTWLAPSRAAVANEAVAPGAKARFSWTLVAPEVSETTTFEETFQLVQEGVTWFGPKQTISITVNPAGSETDDGDDRGAVVGGCVASQRSAGPLVLLGVLLAVRRRRKR